MASPTEKQIRLVEAMTDVFEIDFPQSSKEFTKQIYYKFIEEYYEEYRHIVDDVNDFQCEDELQWFQVLNG